MTENGPITADSHFEVAGAIISSDQMSWGLDDPEKSMLQLEGQEHEEQHEVRIEQRGKLREHFPQFPLIFDRSSV